MGGQHILLVNEDPDLSKEFQRTFEKTGTGLTFLSSTMNLGQHLTKNSYSMIILESKKGFQENLMTIFEKNSTKDFFLIVGTSQSIRSGAGKIQELSNEIKNDEKKTNSQTISTHSSRDLFLNDFVERKLKDFVKRMSLSQGRNLYSLLIKEIEKPLITMILNETKGNQVQAAHMLGVNRNTLRKKIKELKITIKRTKK
ncbi:MAG TPA: helix-turn-helix domain-containing protein [Nitrospiria bacterium]|jgi:two-component system nitrogen regulation response regulator GlnG